MENFKLVKKIEKIMCSWPSLSMAAEPIYIGRQQYRSILYKGL